VTTIDLFLDELKFHYKHEFELKSSLENKANYLLVAAGVTMSLLFTFGTELIGKVNPEYDYFQFVVGFFMLSVISNGISILFSILGFSIKYYRYTMPYNAFFKKDPSTKKVSFNNQAIEEYRDGLGDTDSESIQIFKESIIENYLRFNRQNGLQNSSKATKIKIAQWLFFVGAITIPFIIIFALPFLWQFKIS
jgi:hypothetical protein